MIAGLSMGLFDFLKPQGSSRKLLLDLVVHNADVIERNEGRSRNDAEYLAICLIIDDLRKRPNGRHGYQTLIDIVEKDYPQQLNDIITYVAWSTGRIHLNPEAEATMKKRLAK